MGGLHWLKRMNARGGDILVRPLAGPELRLIGTLDAAGVGKLRTQGLAPAATVETSPGRFEAWVKLSDRPLTSALREALLARVHLGLNDAGLYGRLAGFTNQKAKPDEAGRQPFSLLHNATGQVAPAAVQPAAGRPGDAARTRPSSRGHSR
jgi:hypothetical protein